MKNWTNADIDRLKSSGTGKGWKAQAATLPFVETKKPGRKATPSLPKISTNDLTKATIQYFRAKGFWCWRVNTMGVWDAEKGVYRKNNAMKGVSDIIGYSMRDGKATFLAVEIKNKATGDRASVHQEAFLDGVRKAGGHVYVVRTMDDLK